MGNPAEPLVRALRAEVGEATGRRLRSPRRDEPGHRRYRSHARRRPRASAAAGRRSTAPPRRVPGWRPTHRDTPMVARTLLQPAVPTTFGLKAAGWLVSLLDARQRLAEIAALEARGSARRRGRNAGGARGPMGLRSASAFAAELGLREPLLPWHAARGRIAELGQALAEVCERAREDRARRRAARAGGGRRGARAGREGRVLDDAAQAQPRRIGACRAPAHVRHEPPPAFSPRASSRSTSVPIGAWQAEWGALSAGLGARPAALHRLSPRRLEGLEVDTGADAGEPRCEPLRRDGRAASLRARGAARPRARRQSSSPARRRQS